MTAENVVDFTGGYDPAHWTPIWAEALGNWKGMAFLEGVEPPSWVIGDIVRDAGHPGILYRSTRQTQGVCLVLFPDALRSAFSARAHDPSHALPRDDSSWKEQHRAANTTHERDSGRDI